MWLSYRSVPFYRDEDGFPHGTGVEQVSYSSGAPKIVTLFRRGQHVTTTWYLPDGSEAFITEWHDGQGLWYWFDDVGVLKQSCNMKNGYAEGVLSYYNPDGSIAKKVLMEEGVEVDDS